MVITLCLTHACNLRCAYCYAGRKRARHMTWPTARRAVEFALEQSCITARLSGSEAKCQLGFFGGEPFLRWPLLRRATLYAEKESARRGVRLIKTVTTNMTLLDAPKVRWLRAHGFYVGLSIDGHAAMHDRLRVRPGGRGSHAACSRALALLTRLPAPSPRADGTGFRYEAIVVPDPRNVGLLAAGVEWLAEQGVRQISINPNFYIDWPKPARAAWRRAYERVARFYAARYRAGDPVKVNVLDGKIRTHLKGGYEACDRCGFGEREAAVSPAGHLYPCERLVGEDNRTELRLGNVFDGFDPVRRAAVLACRGNRTPSCRSCGLRHRCMNWCGCINHATTGATDQVAGIVCFHERMSIAVADRVAEALYQERNPAFMAAFYG